jgi:hypothetical protein
LGWSYPSDGNSTGLISPYPANFTPAPNLMTNSTKIIDRQIGRNCELFAQSIGQIETIEGRYPYIRILIDLIEQAHPELNQAPQKDRKIAHFIFTMSKGTIEMDEASEVVKVRDEERGFFYD